LDAKELGERIRKAREQLGLSQEDFAQRISRDQRAVSEYENGKRRISVTDLPTFARVLNVPLLYFFEGELELTDLDRLLLEEFHRLSTPQSRQSAVALLRVFSDAFEVNG
jgi:repressor LexA